MAKTSEIERQVRYWVRTKTGAEEFDRYLWTFLIINDLRNIGIIKEKILEQLRPVEPAFKSPLNNGPVEIRGGLYYDYFSFSSEMGKIADPYKIYNSKKFKKDRDLLQGKNEGELERYVLSIIQGKK